MRKRLGYLSGFGAYEGDPTLGDIYSAGSRLGCFPCNNKPVARFSGLSEIKPCNWLERKFYPDVCNRVDQSNAQVAQAKKDLAGFGENPVPLRRACTPVEKKVSPWDCF